MSLLGKILAVLNVLAAATFFYLVAADWGERQKWTYAVFRQDLVIDGLPLDENAQDMEGTKVVDKISPETVIDLFKTVGGVGDKTQVAECRRVQNKLREEVEGAANDQAKREKLRNILVPLVRLGAERDALNGRIFGQKQAPLGDVMADFDKAFGDTLTKSEEPSAKRQAIAHLLFNIASRPEPADLQRVAVVIGLKAFINEANQQADAVRVMGERLTHILAEEQAAFERDHARLVAELRLLALEETERKKKFGEVEALRKRHEELYNARTQDLKALQDRIANAGQVIKDSLNTLDKEQKNLVQAQQRVVKLAEENQQLERKIRELEKVSP
ncbi:MAG TPA: hypothetical protein VGY77_11940 [Gemmataceae bacterium]|jgi:DNA repair exonuclease SbcCD ATPase subunit|nr:hypothetical protein [Gemmataceae bacterium]